MERRREWEGSARVWTWHTWWCGQVWMVSSLVLAAQTGLWHRASHASWPPVRPVSVVPTFTAGSTWVRGRSEAWSHVFLLLRNFILTQGPMFSAPGGVYDTRGSRLGAGRRSTGLGWEKRWVKAEGMGVREPKPPALRGPKALEIGLFMHFLTRGRKPYLELGAAWSFEGGFSPISPWPWPGALRFLVGTSTAFCLLFQQKNGRCVMSHGPFPFLLPDGWFYSSFYRKRPGDVFVGSEVRCTHEPQAYQAAQCLACPSLQQGMSC